MSEEGRRLDRRKMLASIGSVGVAATAGCTGKIKKAVGSGKSKFQKQLETVREKTKKYDGNPDKALDDGFEAMGPYIPGMGWHFQHKERIQNAAKNGFKVEEPQILGFDEDFNLGYVEYGGPSKIVPKSPDLFADEGKSNYDNESWETHGAATHVFAKPDGKVNNIEKVPREEFLNPDNWAEKSVETKVEVGDKVTMPFGGTSDERIVDFATKHPPLTSLHVWVHIENPEGIFSPLNPKFAQR